MGAPTFLSAARANAITLGQFQPLLVFLTNSYPTEAGALITARADATFSNMASSVDNQGTARVTMFRKNNADTALSPTITDSATGVYYDTTNKVSLANGDTFNLNLRGTAPAYIPYICQVMHQTTGAVTGNYYGSTNNTYTAAANNFGGILAGSTSTTEAGVQMTMRTAGTASFFTIEVSTSSVVASTAFFRKAGADGSQNVTVGAGLTGQFIDTTNTDTWVSGDLINYRIANATPGTMRFAGFFYGAFTSTDTELGTTTGGWTFSASNQFIALLGGQQTPFFTTESLVQVRLNIPGKLSKTRFAVISNTFTGSGTIRLRKNGANANQTITFGAGVTGQFEDTTNIDTFESTDTLNWIITGGTSGLLAWGAGAILLQQHSINPPIWTDPTLRRSYVGY